MRGIIGFLGQFNSDAAKLNVSRTTASLYYRGPDDGAFWVSLRIAFERWRLSVLELSNAGKQPMVLCSGWFTIVFNGEIHNHHELRRELKHKNWIGNSDTETLLFAI